MCGITGFLTASFPGHAEEVVGGMADALRHRGPDDHGTWVDAAAGIALGHRRLSIIDTSAAGRQPMMSGSGRYVLSYNGEIYNYREVQAELEQSNGQPLRLRGHSDTEIILAGFEQWGIPSTVERFNGMFALAVWDRLERMLWLARDPFGEKPLYYAWFGETFLFGSELKALRAHPDFDGSLDRNALAQYFKFNCVPAPHSIYRQVKKLPAASVMKISLLHAGEASPVPYWSMEETALQGLRDPFRGPVEEAIEELDQLLRSAVKLRTVSDVPLGTFLSGGFDSSLVTALMQAQHNNAVQTFSVGVSDKDLDEGEYARQVAGHLGTEHAALTAAPEDALAVLQELPLIYDEPFSDSSQIPTLLLSRFARRSVTVALSGDGGDEIFGGYNRHTWLSRLWRNVGWLPGSMRKTMAAGIRSASPAAWDRVYAGVSPLLPRRSQFAMAGYKLHKFASVLEESNPRTMYLRLLAHWPGESIVIGASANGPDVVFRKEIADIEHDMMLLDTQQYLHDDILVKVDRATMSTSLEARAPYLDKRVVAFAWRLPLEWKVRQGVGKWILRQVLYRYVPQAMVDRPKRGFSVPLDQWLRGELRDWAESLLDASRLRQEGFLDPGPIHSRWEEHRSRKRNWAFELWDVLMFQSWLEHSRRAAPVAAPQVAG